MYEYRARCTKVVDGDTFDFAVDLGFHTTHTIRVRLKDVDTPEMNSKNAAEREHAQLATDFVRDELMTPPCAHHNTAYPIVIRTKKDKIGIYGRYTATVTLEDGRDLGELLISKDLVKLSGYPEKQEESDQKNNQG